MDLDSGFDYCTRLDNLAEAEAAAFAVSQILASAVGCFDIDCFDFDSDWLLDGS